MCIVPVFNDVVSHVIVVWFTFRFLAKKIRSTFNTAQIANMESSFSSPTIDDSIQYLKNYLLSCTDQGLIAHSAVKVYISSMHLLCAIKQEQLSIAEYGYVR
jgi:hypothetical protein